MTRRAASIVVGTWLLIGVVMLIATGVPARCSSGSQLDSPWALIYLLATLGLLGGAAMYFDGLGGADVATMRRICIAGCLAALLLAIVGLTLSSRGYCSD